MSAFVVHKSHIDAILTAGLAYMRVDGSPVRWYHPALSVDTPSEIEAKRHELRRETAAATGAMLWAQNTYSVRHRYGLEEAPDREYTFTRHALLSPVELFKALDCYWYQSCEDSAQWAGSEAKAFVDALAHRAIGHLPGYREAAWEVRPG